MTQPLLELQRARKRLDAFCRLRAVSQGAGSQWRLDAAGNELVLSAADAGGGPVLRLRFEGGRWMVSVPAGGQWRPYPPLPEAAGIESIMHELEQAPLHIHWTSM